LQIGKLRYSIKLQFKQQQLNNKETMKKLLLTTVLAVATIVAMANPIGRTAAMQKA
jgi:hypothetical protein